MRHTAPAAPSPQNSTPLAALGLPAEDFACLARQGFVAAESGRGAGATYYKLRWRRDGRQRVVYLGRDAGRAEEVRAALDVLREPLRLVRQLERQMKEVRRGLRQVKGMLALHAGARGPRYHGYTARGRVRPAAEPTQETPDRKGRRVANSLPRTAPMEGTVDD